MNNKSITYFLLVIYICIWGLEYVFAKTALETIAPMNLIFLKYSVGIIFTFIIKMKMDRKTLIRRRDIPVFIICALTGEILYFFCEYNAMSFIPVALITIILNFCPIISLLVERVLFKRKISLKIVGGIIACIIGVAIVIGADVELLRQGNAIGYILAFIAVISWVIYNFVTESLTKKYETSTVSFFHLLCSVLIVAPYGIHTMPPAECFTPEVIGGILYLGAGSACVAFLIINRGLRVCGPTVVSMFSSLLPVTSAFFGWIFLGQAINGMQIIGGIIVIFFSIMIIREKGRLDQDIEAS